MITGKQAAESVLPLIIRERISYLYALKRKTVWRSEAYRCILEIEDLKKRLKEVTTHCKKGRLARILQEENNMHIIDLAGPEGNVFAIFGLASKWNRQLDRKRSLSSIVEKKHPNGDYNDVLNEFDKMFKAIDYTFINDPRDPDTREDE